MPVRREQVAAALKYLGDKADLRGRAERALSLDPQEQDLADIAVEGIASLAPGVGQALAARDVERARRANDPAGMAMASMGAVPGGRLAGLLKRYDPTRAEIFIGKSAKTYDPKAEQRAIEMEKAGIDRDTIWRETGTGRVFGPDWKQEISDADAYLRQDIDFDAAIDQRKAQIAAINQQVRQLKEGAKTQPDLFPREFNKSVRELAATKKPLQEDIKGNYGLEYGRTGLLGSRARLAMQHPELFEAYPDLGQALIIRRNQLLGESTRGAYFPDAARIDIGTAVSYKPTAASSTALHELQHAVQQREGFAKGGSPTQFTTKFDDQLKALKDDLSKALVGNSSSSLQEIFNNFDLIELDKLKQIAQKHGMDSPDAILRTLKIGQQRADPYEQYLRLAGEAEARAVQKRMNMSPAVRRQTPPWQSLDVPEEELIFKR